MAYKLIGECHVFWRPTKAEQAHSDRLDAKYLVKGVSTGIAITSRDVQAVKEGKTVKVQARALAGPRRRSPSDIE